MRWEDYVKRDLGRVGGEWRTTAKDRSWRQLIENIVREVRKENTQKKVNGIGNLPPPPLPPMTGPPRGEQVTSQLAFYGCHWYHVTLQQKQHIWCLHLVNDTAGSSKILPVPLGGATIFSLSKKHVSLNRTVLLIEQMQ